MSLKDTKILIPEIPKEWTRRTRAGNTNVWNDKFFMNGLPEVKLEPPMRGLYAERFEDGWYWVCGCVRCLDSKDWAYINCDEHDTCITCGTHIRDIKGSVWGHPKGFVCNTCRTHEKEEAKQSAMQQAELLGLDEWDHFREDSIVCPVCFTKHEDHENPSDEYEMECSVCDAKFEVEVEYEPKYTTKLISEGEE